RPDGLVLHSEPLQHVGRLHRRHSRQVHLRGEARFHGVRSDDGREAHLPLSDGAPPPLHPAARSRPLRRHGCGGDRVAIRHPIPRSAMNARVQRVMFSLALLYWGGVLVYFYSNGRILKYLAPDFRPLALVGGLGLLIVGLFNLLTSGEKASCGGDRVAIRHPIPRSAMNARVQRVMFSLALLYWGGVLVYFYSNGRILKYLAPDFRPLALVGGLGLLIVGLFNLLTSGEKASC